MTLQLKQFKQSIIKTEQSQEFQEPLTRDYPALVNSVLWAHSPIYSLLSLVVCWCSRHWYWSWTQYSTDALFHALHTMHFCSDILPLLNIVKTRSLLLNTLTRHDKTVHLLPCIGLICCQLHFSNFLLPSSHLWISIFSNSYLLLVREGSGMLAALMSEASWVGRLLGAIAIYCIMHLLIRKVNNKEAKQNRDCT